MRITTTLLLLYVLVLPAFAQSLSVTTAPWQPYIDENHGGKAANLFEQIMSQNNTAVEWQRQNYDLGFAQVVSGQKHASFPYFKTSERAQQVLFSRPVFQVTSHLYFNRQYQKSILINQLGDYRIGRVAGYSYGEKMDAWVSQGKIFINERQALQALLDNDIDYLPMTESVMNHMLNTQFSAQKLLILPVENIADHASLHLIASKTPKGEAIVDQVNRLIEQAASFKSLQLEPERLTKSPDLAVLNTSEGYPAIIAQTDLSGSPSYYSLANGTKALVVEWGLKMTAASKTDHIYQNMMEMSKVVILNGPLVGKEVYVKNMHIELQ